MFNDDWYINNRNDKIKIKIEQEELRRKNMLKLLSIIFIKNIKIEKIWYFLLQSFISLRT